MAAITICSDFGAQKNKVWHCPLYPHLFPMKWWDQMPWSSFSQCWALSQHFLSSLSLSSRGFLVFTFCHKGGVICISDVIDISPSNLDSSLCFFQPSVSHDVEPPIWASPVAQHLHCRRHRRCGFDPWVGKIPWRRAWQPTLVFLPQEFHGEEPAVYNP